MQVLAGRQPLAPFRLARLQAALTSACGRPLRLQAEELFLVETTDSPLPALLALLHAHPVEPAALAGKLCVVPRRGTRSAWASRAEDILARCGLGGAGRIERGLVYAIEGVHPSELPPAAAALLHDRMTEDRVADPGTLAHWFDTPKPGALAEIELGASPREALARCNRELGLALDGDEIDYLVDAFVALGRNPTDAELMMFAQANSEHCRHKIFNADWIVDGKPLEDSLFGRIRTTHARVPDGVRVAYDDNAAVLAGFDATVFAPFLDDSARWQERRQALDIQIKVETHNHPTAISPDPGAATGAGGEIRDEAATGRGARPVAGLSGFAVGDLAIPGLEQPWERAPLPPDRLATPLSIMLEGPVGAARYNNEFGRPALAGYFRTLGWQVRDHWWGYYKPIMLAGGMGRIAAEQTQKLALAPGHRIIVLGGPAMMIGLGGGAASSLHAGQSSAELDYASVQRANPEMQRRCQEVIDRCWQLGETNPIASIHDVGAGGLSNAIPELLHDGGVGGALELRAIPSADPSLSPMAIWCNESQERYVLAVAEADFDRFAAICARERCPMADLGPATAQAHLTLADTESARPPVDLSLDVLFGNTPRRVMQVDSETLACPNEGLAGIELSEALERVLVVPAVGSKQCLITIGDRTVGGLTVRDPMVGPWQVPVADCAITLTDYQHDHGSALAIGERAPLAIWNPAASARMAVAEALLNLAGCVTAGRRRIKLSANWMAAAAAPGQAVALRQAVEAITGEFCDALELAIPVGKDSLSMTTRWQHDGEALAVTAPVSLNVTAFAPVPDVRRHITPLLADHPSSLWLLAPPGQRLGGSALAQAFVRELGDVPDIDEPARLALLFDTVQALVADGVITALHDRSDGGLIVSLLEMAFAARRGLSIVIPSEMPINADPLAFLFNEEIGLVVQVPEENAARFEQALAEHGLTGWAHRLGAPIEHPELVVARGDRELLRRELAELHTRWAATSHALQRLRDDPDCADEEHAARAEFQAPGLSPVVPFAFAAPAVNRGTRPRVAIVREQGVNGQREMAMAFHRAGFDAFDVHMSDLEAGVQQLDGFHGLVLPGGFSFGDVLGAGRGWARSILFNPALAEAFRGFFADPSKFALGVCNGCQVLAQLAELVPGSDHWPRFVDNRSRQFEARLGQVEILDSPSLFLAGMAGARLPVVVAHGEGRAAFADPSDAERVAVTLRYVDGHGRVAACYPDNPNGSPDGITGICNRDGRITLMMPHPERLLRALNYSWAPPEWGDHSPWMKMFDNARAWVEGAV
ncbi:MAG: phosphoribosylformylglycinamidine synthase [Wenzhouxiangellaceae bacterium]|nr:phosphoribosylformylglycinamidine synthase [Wenzhouxiangellaceae bacterium]